MRRLVAWRQEMGMYWGEWWLGDGRWVNCGESERWKRQDGIVEVNYRENICWEMELEEAVNCRES